MVKKRQIKLTLNELNPNHEAIIDWLDSLDADGRGKQTSIHLERAMLEYIRQIKAPRVTRQKSEKIQASQPRKVKKIEEKRILTRQPIAEVAYEDSQPQRQSGEISSAALRLINNSDFD